MSTTYRAACGTRFGISLHIQEAEDVCGACLEYDHLARARHEARQPIPERPKVVADMQQLIGVLARLMEDADRAKRAARRAA